MSPMGVIAGLSQTELNEALVIQRAVDGHLSIREAALILGLSERQTKAAKKGQLYSAQPLPEAETIRKNKTVTTTRC